MTQQNIRENQYPPYPILIFFTVFFSYLIFLEPLPEWNSNRSIALVQAIVNDHSFKINSFHEITGDKVLYKGDYYSGGAPGLALIALPFYIPYSFLEKVLPWSVPSIFLHMYLTAMIVCTSGALLAVLLWNLLRSIVDDRRAFFLTIVFSFGTIEFFYSLRFFAHIPSSLMSFGAFWVLFRTRYQKQERKSWKSPFAAGVLIGASIFVDYVAMPMGAFFLLYALLIVEWRRLHFFFLGYLVGLAPLIVYHFVYFDALFWQPLKYVHYGPVEKDAQILAELCLGQKITMVGKNYLRLLLGPQRGHLFYMPVFFVSLYGFFCERGNRIFRKEILLSSVLLLGYPLIIGSRPVTWTGGSAFGVRYMAHALPFMMLGVAFAFSSRHKLFLILVCSVSVCINIFGVCSGDVPHDKDIFYLIERHIEAFPLTPPFLRMRKYLFFYISKFLISSLFLIYGWIKWGRQIQWSTRNDTRNHPSVNLQSSRLKIDR